MGPETHVLTKRESSGTAKTAVKRPGTYPQRRTVSQKTHHDTPHAGVERVQAEVPRNTCLGPSSLLVIRGAQSGRRAYPRASS